MGVLAIIIFLGIKYFGIRDIGSSRFLKICLIPAYSRVSMLIAMRFLGYCREMGTAKGFFESPVKPTEFVPFIPIMLASIYLGKGFILLNSLFFYCYLFVDLFLQKDLGLYYWGHLRWHV